jgi:uncharacterized protein (DUF1697 family)
MTKFVALLRAVNVGGTGKLPMKQFAALCGGCGFDNVRTYIQSGNVVFESRRTEKAVHDALAKALTKRMGKPADLVVRTAAEMRAILKANPFPDKEGAKVAVAFLSGATPRRALDDLVATGDEDVRPGKRAIYVYYPNGMGRSKLKLPKELGVVTVRNINTVGNLVEMMAG